MTLVHNPDCSPFRLCPSSLILFFLPEAFTSQSWPTYQDHFSLTQCFMFSITRTKCNGAPGLISSIVRRFFGVSFSWLVQFHFLVRFRESDFWDWTGNTVGHFLQRSAAIFRFFFLDIPSMESSMCFDWRISKSVAVEILGSQFGFSLISPVILY